MRFDMICKGADLSAIDGLDGPARGIGLCRGGSGDAFLRGASMDQPTAIGLDPARNVFQGHGGELEGNVRVSPSAAALAGPHFP